MKGVTELNMEYKYLSLCMDRTTSFALLFTNYLIPITKYLLPITNSTLCLVARWQGVAADIGFGYFGCKTVRWQNKKTAGCYLQSSSLTTSGLDISIQSRLTLPEFRKESADLGWYSLDSSRHIAMLSVEDRLELNTRGVYDYRKPPSVERESILIQEVGEA